MRNAVFSFHIDEKETLAVDVQRILKDEFGLESALHEYPAHNGCKIICSKVDLVKQLSYWFGDGCANKKLPGQSLFWPVAVQKALIRGYLDGDGNSYAQAKTTSRNLAFGLYALGIQCGSRVGISHMDSYVDKKGLRHSESWCISFPVKEGLAGFFEPIGDTLYYWSIVDKVSAVSDIEAEVVDITVEGTSSFVSKSGNVHSCGCAGSIFEAAHFLEDKPLSGHGFLMDTVPYLAAQFGVQIPRLDLNPEDLYEMETYQAYQHAAYVIRNSTPSARVQARLAEYSWSKEVLAQIGIGSVASYDDYLHKMTVTYGHKREFLKEVDLDRKGLFNENNLIYTVKDEHGSPVGFAARDLLYEEKQQFYEKQVALLAKEFVNDEAGFKEAKAKLFRPRKYNNSAESEVLDGETRPKNTIYKKGTRLFNFDLAKKATPPLEVFDSARPRSAY